MSAKAARAGRIGGVEKARALVALASSLDNDGDALTAGVISQRLGVSLEDAEGLLDLVLLAGGEQGGSLPLYFADDDSLALMPSAQSRGRGVKLTKSEALAVISALAQAGVGEQDPLFVKLSSALSSPLSTHEVVKRLLSTPASPDEAFALSLCAHALAEGQCLSFDYKGLRDKSERRRYVTPTALVQQDGAWYLDAIDNELDARRRFRIDRMGGVALDAAPASEPSSPEAANPKARDVELVFSDPALLKLLHWSEIASEEPDSQGRVRARIPYYGGMWLPRMVAACGTGVACLDEEVSALARAYARQLLDS